MLYIKFNIQDNSKYEDFKKLYEYMDEVRQPGFKFIDEGPEFDWDSMKTQEEVDAAVEELNDFLDTEPEARRYKEIIPSYVNVFLEKFLQIDNEKLGSLGIHDALSLFNYLETGFEVDMDTLEKINEHSGIVNFSTGNYPFGGMERFLVTLKAYNLLPTECFDGFTICKFEWRSDFEYTSTQLPEKTKEYLRMKQN